MSHAAARTDSRHARGTAAERSWTTDLWPTLRSAVKEAREHDVTTTAQALAYSFFLAIPSLFLVVLGVFSLVASPTDVTGLVQRFERVAPPEAGSLLGDSLQRSLDSSHTGLGLVIVGFVLALWSTTSAATTLMKAVTAAFDQSDDRGFVHKRLLALLLVACLLGAALLVVGLLVLGPFLERWIGGAVGAPGATAWIWW